MKAICPNDPKPNDNDPTLDHKNFYTSAHVVQTWKVNPNGDFCEEISNDDVTHSPHKDNTWECCTCGASATFEN